MKFLNMIKFKTKEHSPEILMGIGFIGIIASTVSACKATRKIDPILDAHKISQENIHKAIEDGTHTEKEIKRATTKLYVRTGFDFVKLYAPAAGLGIFSLGCIFASNEILRKRNASLAAAYAILDKTFKEYRKRVVERYDEETDYELLTGTKTIETQETITDSKGKEKTVTKKQKVADPNASSDYIKYFTKSNQNWDKNDDFNLNFFECQQHFANDKLRRDGYLVLNDVLESLGFEKTQAGMVVGWVYDLKNPNGDNKVQFTITKVKIPGEDGILEDAYAIDFNVDGNIYPLIK